MTGHYIVRRKDLGCAKWDAFADCSDHAWLWHRYDFQDALATWPGRSDESFALVSLNEERPLALIPLSRITKRVLGLLPVYSLESFGGVAFRGDLGEKQRRGVLMAVRDELARRADKGLCPEVRIALSPMAPAMRGSNCPRVNPLLEMGCDNRLSQTWVVDLRDGSEAVWKQMEGRARTAVRKAENAGVVVREAKADDRQAYFHLHQETYRRTGASPHAEAYFTAIWNRFLASGHARIWMAELHGETVAAENFGVCKQAAIYWTGAASVKGLDVEANSLLQWNAMRWFIDQGFEWYETGEAFPQSRTGKQKGLNDFKKSFGGRLYPYYKGRLSTGGLLGKVYQLKTAI